MTTFPSILPRLASTFEAGRLVPFIGSGMSVPVCTDWWTFVHALETVATGKVIPAFTEQMPRDELVQRANSAVRTLKAKAPGVFTGAVRKALVNDPPSAEIPAQTRALTRLWWPLVLTTNYDDCYVAAARAAFPDRQMAIVGRGVEDCQRVLTSLSVPGRSLLWTLQGYLGAPLTAEHDNDLEPLAGQLVVGHEEYRRVTYRDVHFRRAFAEVFRQRSLLFLGAGIQETYLQELFGEVLEHFGPTTRPHYAFISAGKVDPDFMLSRFQIIVVEYKGKHETVIEQLNALADAIGRPRQAPVSWSWGRVVADDKAQWQSVPDLEVVRGPLPTVRAEKECLAVSAGGSEGSFFFSDGIQQLVQDWKVRRFEQPEERSVYVGEYVDRHVFAVRARSADDERSLSHIYDASLDLFERVAGAYRCIRMQLLATGGKDKRGAAGRRWMVRDYPERFSFIQTVRAWGAWREAHPDVDCRLALHVVLDSVYHDVASGRIDVLELLSCRDVRFFVEIVNDTSDLERRLFQMMPDTRLDELVRQLQLSPDHWKLAVTPPPSLEDPLNEPVAKRGAETLLSLGVVPGSTIHFRRLE